MYTTLIILVMILAVILILAVLIQNPKGGGLTSQFTGAGSTQLFGVKQTGDLLEQITWGLATVIGVLVLATVFFVQQPGDNAVNSINVEKAQSKSLPNPTPPPVPQQQPAPATPAPAPQK